MKGVLELLAIELGTSAALIPNPEPFLHPGRAAAIGFDAARAGWIGELHPLVAARVGPARGRRLRARPGTAGRRVRDRERDVRGRHHPPAVLQDLAVTVADDVTAERVRDAVRAGGGSLLERAEIFDVYRGEQLEKGTKSLALRLRFRAPDRTLTDEVVAAQRERIKEALAEIGGSIRE